MRLRIYTLFILIALTLLGLGVAIYRGWLFEWHANVRQDVSAPNRCSKEASNQAKPHKDATGVGERPATAAAGPEQHSEDPPKTKTSPESGNSTSRAKPSDLPVGKPEMVKPPQLSARGKSDQYTAWLGTPELKFRFRGQNPNSKCDAAKNRRIHGHVYEIRVAERVPLEGVEVMEQFANQRTFSDASGRFEFDAKRSGEDPDTGEFKVNLVARSPGYQLNGKVPLVIGRSADVETEQGIPIYMTKAVDETVRVKISNPELARGDLTVTLAAYSSEYGNDFSDMRLAVSVIADENGEAWFSVPPDTLSLKGVLGDGVCMDWSGNPKPKAVVGGKLWEVSLIRCDNYLMTGTVTDMRTGAPVRNTLIKGKERNELTLTNDDGGFVLWVSVDPKQFITVHAFHYTAHLYHPDPFTDPGNGPGIVTPPAGKDSAGPWGISLRPWVTANVKVVVPEYTPRGEDQLSWKTSLNESWPGLPLYATVNGEGVFVFNRLPWGTCEFALAFERNGQRSVLPLTVMDADWNGDGPWSLTATQGHK